MNPEESILQNLGNNSSAQWYELYPERLDEEIVLLHSAFPELILEYTPGQNISWTGKVTCKLENDSELYSLIIKIECSRDYPIVFPKVTDVNSILFGKQCPHLHDDKKTLCYGNRLDSSLNFTNDTRIKNVAEYVAVFLGRQWYFERYGYWPDGQLHGMDTFLEYEIKTRKIEPDSLCPCALNSKTYKECHMKGVANLLQQMERNLKPEISVKIQKPGRNDSCPCGKKKGDGRNMKYKACCERTLNFPNSKVFLLLKFKDYYLGS